MNTSLMLRLSKQMSQAASRCFILNNSSRKCIGRRWRRAKHFDRELDRKLARILALSRR